MSTQPLNPQGYNITKSPINTNPFWEHETPGGGGGVPEGGLTGEVLTKASDADYDTEWAPIDAPTAADLESVRQEALDAVDAEQTARIAEDTAIRADLQDAITNARKVPTYTDEQSATVSTDIEDSTYDDVHIQTPSSSVLQIDSTQAVLCLDNNNKIRWRKFLPIALTNFNLAAGLPLLFGSVGLDPQTRLSAITLRRQNGSMPYVNVTGSNGNVTGATTTGNSSGQIDAGRFIVGRGSAPSSTQPSGVLTGPISGGTAGQVLTKLSSTNYDWGWTTPSGGGGSQDASVITLTGYNYETVKGLPWMYVDQGGTLRGVDNYSSPTSAPSDWEAVTGVTNGAVFFPNAAFNDQITIQGSGTSYNITLTPSGSQVVYAEFNCPGSVNAARRFQVIVTGTTNVQSIPTFTGVFNVLVGPSDGPGANLSTHTGGMFWVSNGGSSFVGQSNDVMLTINRDTDNVTTIGVAFNNEIFTRLHWVSNSWDSAITITSIKVRDLG